MAKITITWQPDKVPETNVSLSKEFKALSSIEKLDCLKDALCDLSGLYDSAHDQFNREFEKLRKKRKFRK